jgi:hypothetical protein
MFIGLYLTFYVIPPFGTSLYWEVIAKQTFFEKPFTINSFAACFHVYALVALADLINIRFVSPVCVIYIDFIFRTRHVLLNAPDLGILQVQRFRFNLLCPLDRTSFFNFQVRLNCSLDCTSCDVFASVLSVTSMINLEPDKEVFREPVLWISFVFVSVVYELMITGNFRFVNKFFKYFYSIFKLS